ncbi:MAG: hypothetical protein JWO31_3907 [Phycisphaerales bacterium]|nr:hypothetical protein [Phycisphaerales bacterium]
MFAGGPPAGVIAMPDPSPDPLPDPPAGPAPVPAKDLLPLVYDHLRRLARQRMATERTDHTLQATALAHEAFARIVGPSGADAPFADAAQFFNAAAEAMRRILIEHARTHGAKKRGGSGRRVEFSSVLDLAVAPDSEENLAFDDALLRLERETPLAARVVRLRFYAGLSVDDTATALGVAPRTVDREWKYARAWLFRVLGSAAAT